ncbi:MAG: hypothetical protein AAB962_02640 [Patescibacteria group bacterium]
MKQNLLKAVCPICKTSVHSLVGCVKMNNAEKLPDKILEDKCPDCLLEITKGAIAIN